MLQIVYLILSSVSDSQSAKADKKSPDGKRA